MKMKLYGSAAILAASMLVASAASAATLIETGSYGFSPTDFTTTDGNAGEISLAQFNPALGKLNSIVITFTANDEATATATNNNPKGSKSISAKLDSKVVLHGPDGAGMHTFGSLTPTETVTDNLAAGATTTFGGLLQSSLTDTYTLNPTSPSTKLFNSFVGTGLYNFVVDATGASIVKGTGNFASSISTEAQGIVTVDYNYTAVPEPATWAVMLVGFGGMGVAMRSRRRQVTA